jgi:hypothetical protein
MSTRAEILAKKMGTRRAKHSEAGKKAWETIRKNQKRSEASRKAWQTRRENQKKAQEVDE